MEIEKTSNERRWVKVRNLCEYVYQHLGVWMILKAERIGKESVILQPPDDVWQGTPTT